jgi:hypothetical protein
MAIQGLLDYDDLRAKLASLEEARKTAEQELTILKDRRKHIAELEQGKVAILEYYAGIAPEALDALTPEERQHLYNLLQLKALQHPDGKLEAETGGILGPELVQRKSPAQVFAQPSDSSVFHSRHASILACWTASLRQLQ